MSTPVAIGIDIGGTRLRAATVAADGSVLERRGFETPARDENLLVEAVGDVVVELGPTLPVGVGIAALVTPEGIVRYGPNILVRDVPLAVHLGEVTSATVTIANDASVAAFGEQRAGAGRAREDVVLFTLGTGIGGGIVVGGELLLGRNGFGGELGHVVVCDEGRRCPCGSRGCIEAYASGTALGAIARERLAANDEPSLLREVGEVRGQDVSRAAEAGDDLARGVLEDAGHWLGVAAGTMANALDPELILVGGGAARATAPILLPAARRALASGLIGSPWREPPPLELAVLGDDAGIVGAALLAAERHARVVA